MTHPSLAVRDTLVDALRADLVGPMQDDEVLPLAPSRFYLTGFLVPRGGALTQRQDDEIDSDGAEVGDQGDTTPTDSPNARKAFLPSSIGLSVLVPADATVVTATVCWAAYGRCDDEDARPLWAEYNAKIAAARGKPAPEPHDDEDEGRPRAAWQRIRTHQHSVPLDLTRGADQTVPVPGAPGVQIRLHSQPVHTDASTYALQGQEALAVSVFLVNAREVPDTHRDEANLYQAGLQLTCASGLLPRRTPPRTSHLDDRRNDLQYRHHAEHGVGLGVSVAEGPLPQLQKDPDAARAESMTPTGPLRTVHSTWLPQATIYRMKASSLPGVTLDMRTLATLTAEGVTEAMGELPRAYRRWILAQADRVVGATPGQRDTAQELMRAATHAADRIEAGLALLRSDAQVLTAFKMANLAMAGAAAQERGDDRPAWRLFQLAFLLLNLPGLHDAHHPDRTHVDLLFFPTGGGKTEAYLGVAATTLLLRRLRHAQAPHGGQGVSVLLRYTLRLLTLDQLRRAALLTCALELIRRTRTDTLGTTRFSIGLWVGAKASPNRIKDARDALKRQVEHNRAPDPPLVPFTGCPWCGTPLTTDAFHFSPGGQVNDNLHVGCQNSTCPFGFEPPWDAEGWFVEGLGSSALAGPAAAPGIPVVCIDEHLYREPPSILVATVDKFASLPWRGALGTLFGKASALGPQGLIPHAGQPKPDHTPLPDGVPPPDLILQDELHLITGPLGTMVGLYETAIEALCEGPDGTKPKILAATATVGRAAEQVQALYARRHTHLFPPQGVDEGDTFFAVQDTREQTTRRYVGVGAPGRPISKVLARVYTVLLGAGQRAWEDAGKPGHDNPADTYMTLVTYFNALRELGAAQRMLQEDVAQRLRDLGSREPLNARGPNRFADRVLNPDLAELTSRQSTDAIAAAITNLAKAYASSTKGRPKAAWAKIDALLASNMISVGVDISRLGLMVVGGQPRTVAEYIQASSRVGRSTPGLVVTVANLFRARDRSHFERFTAFHNSFYRHVEPGSVTPFSTRALERGLAGMMVGLARHDTPRMAKPTDAMHPERVDAEALVRRIVQRFKAHRDDAPESAIQEVERWVEQVPKAWQHLAGLQRASAANLKYSPWERESQVPTTLLHDAIVDIQHEHAEDFETFRSPTSMRDVEPSVHIWVDVPTSEGAR